MESLGEMFLDLVKAVWKDKHVPQEWVDAILGAT